MEASYYGMIEEVCVMLIDDDTEFVTKLTNLLKAHNYKFYLVFIFHWIKWETLTSHFNA